MVAHIQPRGRAHGHLSHVCCFSSPRRFEALDVGPVKGFMEKPARTLLFRDGALVNFYVHVNDSAARTKKHIYLLNEEMRIVVTQDEIDAQVNKDNIDAEARDHAMGNARASGSEASDYESEDTEDSSTNDSGSETESETESEEF